jgi:predicted amino acid-binding ACT domain protein
MSLSKFCKYILCLFVPLAVFIGCSTEKNTFINRNYHSITAKYNGYFNAKELIRIGLLNYSNTYREDYFTILPIELRPNEENVVEFYPVVDTAILKCQTVISKHSMPTASKPSKKKTEHARWIDMNWVLIGQAQFLRKDYQNALETFDYVRKFYGDRSSTYYGAIWRARTEIALNLLPDARRSLQKFETQYQNYLSDKGSMHPILYRRKFKREAKENKKSTLAPPFPRKLYYDLYVTKAELALKEKNNAEAIKHLKDALKHTRKKQQKARINFIIGQILFQEGDETARKYFTQCISKNPTFEMGFKAKIFRAMSGGKSEDEVIAELYKMTKEQRYMEYRDQIYFAMANVELKRPDVPMGKKYLSKSVFYSIDNPLQKGMSYEKLGDLTFAERNYVHAQRYFDSAAQVIPETYVNYDQIKGKAENLAALVNSIDIVYFEDSVQRIAAMNPDEREKFLEGVIEQLKEEERIRKQREAERQEQLRKLQMQQAAASGRGGSKFYFSNMKSLNEGFEEFRTMWGQRENEDNWRRKNKELTMLDVEDEMAESEVEIGDLEQEIFDPKTVDPSKVKLEDLTTEILMNSIPVTDSALARSHERLIEHLYRSGMIYKEQLDELELGAKQFLRIVEHGVENEHNVMAAFQLYKINEKTNETAAQLHRSYILNNYPNSDYANFLRDPDYFIKKKEIDALALKDYLRSVERFERGLYFPVVLKAKDVLANEPENLYREQYYLLQVMAMGRINDDKSSLIPVLEAAIEEFPETETAERAQNYIDLIRNGYDPFKPFNFDEAKGLFDYKSKEKMIVLIYVEGKEDVRNIQTRISDFNREFFSRDRLKTSTQIIDRTLTLIKVAEFADENKAQDYIRDFKKTRKHLGEIRDKKIIFISPDNFRVMIKENKLQEYEKFFEMNY